MAIATVIEYNTSNSPINCRIVATQSRRMHIDRMSVEAIAFGEEFNVQNVVHLLSFYGYSVVSTIVQ